MEYEKLKNAVETITMTENMKHRIIKNCEREILNLSNETIMKTKKNTFFRKPAVSFTTLLICMSLSITAIAATGRVQGYFQDIIDYRGAVIGTSYEQATDEISVSADINNDEMIITVNFLNPQEMPYSELERLGIATYQIVDANGKMVKEGAIKSMEIVDGQAVINLQIANLDGGSYKLIITEFVGEKKADQPLKIKGNWECSFSK